MGTGKASGENRAELAADQALTNPLLDDSSIKGAKSVLINISGGLDLTLEEVDIIMQKIVSQVDENANVKFGSTVNEELEGSVQVSIVATGLGEPIKVVDSQTNTEPASARDIEEVHLKTTEIHVTHSETDEPEAEEEPSLIPPGDLGFAPVLPRQETVTPNDLEVEISETNVTIPGSLFSEKAPTIGEATPVKENPKEKQEINLDGQKGSANVKQTTRPNLFDLLPGLLQRGTKNAPKPKETVKKETTPELTGLEESMDLPSFLRRPK